VLDFEHTEYKWVPGDTIQELDSSGQTVPQLREAWLRVADPVACFPAELRCGRSASVVRTICSAFAEGAELWRALHGYFLAQCEPCRIA
jgi:hypothetical protein